LSIGDKSVKQDMRLWQINVYSMVIYNCEGETPERCPIYGAGIEESSVSPSLYYLIKLMVY